MSRTYSNFFNLKFYFGIFFWFYWVFLTKVRIFIVNLSFNIILNNNILLKANFEDNRCRCICPSTQFFQTHNKLTDNNYRRYYTKTGIHPGTW